MRTRILILFFLAIATPLLGQREPVLKQVDLPHPYYWRELYVPQLTTGPSSVCWSADSQELIYSMQGSLWRQRVDSTTAEQLTAGPGYDYQPDCSPDGKWIVFSRYDKDALELHLFNLQTKVSNPLTSGGHVNVEPRWSPDGKKIAFVSTSFKGHFHIFVASLKDGKVYKIQQLTEERKSDLPRYYYSAYDHEISPAWSPDGSELIFVSNRNHIHGTGGFWRMKAKSGADAREIRYEETTWKSRPDWSPDGKRIIYSSYLGRQWHQLWIMTDEGGDPLPLSYGDFDITAPRWSRDGKKIAYISNAEGNTSLWVQEAVGGKKKRIDAVERRYLRPMARLQLIVLNSRNQRVAARVSVTSEDGRAHAPRDVWMHADDSFDRKERAFEPQYFHMEGKSVLEVPAGKIQVEVLRGFEHRFEQRKLELAAGEQRTVTVKMVPLKLPPGWANWINSDLHVHMNYTGTYRNTPAHLVLQAAAEDLDIVNNLIVNKEQRIPDISYFSSKPDAASTLQNIVLHGQEFHTSFWGHIGIIGLKENYLIPDYAAYPNTPAASLYPTNAAVADLAHAQGAVVGYVHPFDTEPDPWKDPKMVERELPVDVALGKVDYYETVGFSDHRATASVWYRLLNCGFRLPPGAGSDTMANYSSLRGPVGITRVYVNTAGSREPARFTGALKEGKTFVTNGPLIGFTLMGRQPGAELKLPAGKNNLKFTAFLRSIVPIDHLEIVSNGNVVKQLQVRADGTSADISDTLTVDKSGWYLLRAWAEKAVYPVLDLYPYATTSPIYVTVDQAPIRSSKDADFFIVWIDKVLEEARNHPSYNTEDEKSKTLKTLTQAREVFEQRRKD